MATRTVVPYRYAIYPNPYSKTKKSIEQKKQGRIARPMNKTVLNLILVI